MFPGIGFHPIYLIVLLAVVLIIFGPGKLPEVGAALGRGINEFKKATNDVAREIQKPAQSEPPAPQQPSASVQSEESPKPTS